MKAKGMVVRLVLAGAGALLPLVAAAQVYRPEAPAASFADSLDRAPAVLSFDLDLVSGKVGADRIPDPGNERPGPWVLYARVYVLNFANNLGEQKLSESQVGFGRTGPAIAGRIYIGIRKRF